MNTEIFPKKWIYLLSYEEPVLDTGRGLIRDPLLSHKTNLDNACLLVYVNDDQCLVQKGYIIQKK